MLQHCLESITTNYSIDLFDIFIVDNMSSDGSPEMVERHFPSVNLIRSPGNIGFGRANNLVKPFVQTPYILFLNPDTIVPKAVITKMIDFIDQHPNVALLGCRMRNPDGKPQELGLQWFPSPTKEFIRSLLVTDRNLRFFKIFLPYIDPDISQFVKKLYGGCLLARRHAMDGVGWFDERYFMYCEDVDLSYQIKKKGWDIYYLAEAEIIHVGGGASQNAGSDFATLMKAESIEKLMEKHYGPTGKWFYRAGIFTAASIRYYLLIVVHFIGLLTFRTNFASYNRSLNKYKALILWSLRLKNAIIR